METERSSTSEMGEKRNENNVKMNLFKNSTSFQDNILVIYIFDKSTLNAKELKRQGT